MAKRFVGLAAVFLAGFGVGLVLWPRLSLPVTNPWGIVGWPAIAGFHPANNILRFLLLIACPAVALGAARLVWPGLFAARSDSAEAAEDPPVWGWLLVALAVLAALNIPTFQAWGQMNRFHEGETLGTAMSHVAGQKPYRDYLFVHGVWQDPVRSAVAFRLFGRSIGAMRTLESSVKIAGFALLGWLLWEAFSRRATAAFAALLFLVALHGLVALEARWLPIPPVWIQPRDITAMAFLLAVVRLWRRPQAGAGALFLTGFVPLASFGYSIDRGFFLTATAVVAVSLLRVGVRRQGRFWLPLAAGAAAGIAALGFLLQWQFAEFVRFTVLIMPRYKEWMDGLEYPIGQGQMWGAAALMALNLFELVRRFLGAPRWGFVSDHFLEITLCVLSFCFFRSVLGRADFLHLWLNSWPACLLAFRLFLWPLLESLGRWGRRGVAGASTAMALICLVQIPRAHLPAQNFPLRRPDSVYLPADYLRAAEEIRSNLGPGESFFTLTSEALWYYLIDRPCPARFPVVWFAAPHFYQQEIIRDLEGKKVKLVLYHNQAPSNFIDGIRNDRRLPLLTAYVREHYVPWRHIEGHEIWIRK